MKDYILIATDIIIDIGRNDKTAIDRIKKEEDNSILSISSITEMELVIEFFAKLQNKFA